MDVLTGLQTTRRASAIDSFDFSTLYTKIPHNKLKVRMSQLINEAYTCRNAEYIEIHNTYASWSSNTICSSKVSARLTVKQIINQL